MMKFEHGSWQDTDLLSQILDFVTKYSFLHDRPNIRFFSEKLWMRIPQDWLWYLAQLDNEELNKFPFQKPTNHCPDSLLEFHIASNVISRKLNSFISTIFPDDLLQATKPLLEVNSTMKAKKRHEVENFAALLTAYCKLHNINRIIDVGCGAGHLISQLGQHFEVFGIECDKKLCQRARKSCKYADIICFKVTCDGSEDQQLLEFLLGNELDRTAIVSLHGCGDLQPTLLRYFCKLDRNRVPVIFTVPCCYHKLSNLDENIFRWTMSDRIRKILIFRDVLSVSALRLACQKHIYNWPCSDAERQRHLRHFVMRGLIECLYDRRGDLRLLACRNLNRRFNNVKTAGAELAFRLGSAETEISEIDLLYKTIYASQEPFFAYVEPFTLLQTMMQIPLEIFLLLDRLIFLEESGCCAYILSVFNPTISSRHLCIMAV